jgi:hypothetical protein
VVAVVHEYEAAVAHVLHEVLFLGRRKLHQPVPAEVAEGVVEQLGAVEGHYFFLGLDGHRGVLHQRVQQVGGHALVHGIPIAGVVAEAHECERSGHGIEKGGGRSGKVAPKPVHLVLTAGGATFVFCNLCAPQKLLPKR